MRSGWAPYLAHAGHAEGGVLEGLLIEVLQVLDLDLVVVEGLHVVLHRVERAQHQVEDDDLHAEPGGQLPDHGGEGAAHRAKDLIAEGHVLVRACDARGKRGGEGRGGACAGWYACRTCGRMKRGEGERPQSLIKMNVPKSLLGKGLQNLTRSAAVTSSMRSSCVTRLSECVLILPYAPCHPAHKRLSHQYSKLGIHVKGKLLLNPASLLSRSVRFAHLLADLSGGGGGRGGEVWPGLTLAAHMGGGRVEAVDGLEVHHGVGRQGHVQVAPPPHQEALHQDPAGMRRGRGWTGEGQGEWCSCQTYDIVEG